MYKFKQELALLRPYIVSLAIFLLPTSLFSGIYFSSGATLHAACSVAF